ncbi:MAG: GGDEF domain-containing phosphodiesterase [Eubacteriales bacterium]
MKEMMDTKVVNYFEILCNDSANPCSVTDIDTYETVFMNFAMHKLLRDVDSAHTTGRSELKCYERMHGRTEPCTFCENAVIVEGEFLETHVYNQKLDKHFRANSMKIEFEGRFYNFCKYFSTSSYASQLITFEDAMTASVEIFSTQKDTEKTTNAFLELIGKYYGAQKAYVFHLNEERKGISKIYQWSSSEHIKVDSDVLSKIPLEHVLVWLEHRDANGVVEVSKDSESSSRNDAGRKLLELLGLENIALSVIVNQEEEPIGLVGCSNRADAIFDPRILTTVTRFVTEGFSKSGMKEELKSIGEIDYLTGFYSRIKYAEMMEQYEKNPPPYLGVVFANINGLRKTNEFLGYAKGDEQIANTAETLRAFFKESFYRISGDEFICFCADENEDDFIKKVSFAQNEIRCSGEFLFALGWAWKKGNVDVQRLTEEADTVMYINKQEYYHISHAEKNLGTDQLLTDLLTYLANDEFMIYLQPQISLLDGSIIGAEALIRRFDKTNQRMVFPDQFIPLYEQNSIIRHVDIFVLNRVCQLLAGWIKEGKGIPISVNLSRVTLIEFDIVNTLATICDNYNVPYSYICIEVTERIGLIENEVATSLIDAFKNKGFRVSLDDFGCAYSNIVTLANITVDEVKIDKSLVDNLLENAKNRIIVDSMVTMCNRFKDTHTLAEGIETGEHADVLRDFGCNYGQGYFYSRPIPTEEFYDKFVSVSGTTWGGNNRGSADTRK